MSKKKRKAVDLPPFVTLRTLSVDFVYRTISIDGKVVHLEPGSSVVTMPLLSGDALFISRGDMERIS
jgi:hypothetical protein